MLDLKLDRPQPLTNVAAGHIGDAILNGQLRPGDRLVETDLSERMGISRAPLREALRELASVGLVELRPGRGAYVAKPTAETMEQMVVFRALVEGAAARLIASEREPAALERLVARCAAVEAAHRAGDYEDFLRRHWEFHHAICEESGNTFLLQSWDSVSKLIRLYHRMAVGQTIDAPSVVRNNKAYMQTLREGDPAEAEELLRSQIIRVAYQLLDRPVPRGARGYITRYVDEAGRVRAYSDPNREEAAHADLPIRGL